MNANVFERFQDAAQNQEFAEKMSNAESTQEALAVMKDYGIDATEDDLFGSCLTWK